MKVMLWRQDTQIRFPVRAAAQHHDQRSRLFLHVEHDGVAGYGEVAPQAQELNGDAALADVIDELRIFVVPQLQQILEREGDLPSWTRVARFAGSRAASNPAVAVVEMALLERELRFARVTIDSLWPVKFDTPLQATISLIDESAIDLDPAVARVRAKLSGAPLNSVAFRTLESLRVPVLLDYNCSARGDTDVIDEVRRIRQVCDVAAVEQPYAVGNVVDTARLAEQLDVAVSIDEGVRSIRDVAQIARYQAAEIVCVKPARVGGLANALTIILRAQEEELRAYVGGFFESPYARRVNRWLANNSVDEPSDLSPVEVQLQGYSREVDEVSDGFGVTPSPEMLECGALLVYIETTI
ncbi:MAG TPA: enolase C-terminal domain-like protein [Acidimicrobiales bacterium]|nr:enolase C-terminal domain-like protein [Acidimicrobiales bacterium]